MQTRFTPTLSAAVTADEEISHVEGDPPILHDLTFSHQQQIRKQQIVLAISDQLPAMNRHKKLRLLSSLAIKFTSIPITANAYVSRMKWADWSQILSFLSKGSSRIPFKFGALSQ